MKKQQLWLVNPPMSENYLLSSRTGGYPLLNLACLKGFIETTLSDIYVRLVDAQMQDVRFDHLEPGCVLGISSNIMTYEAALEIAEHAYQNGSKTILGGPFPSSMAEAILRNREFIDAVVVGDGELALLKYLQSENYEEIPGLVYRKKDRSIICNPPTALDLNELPFPDYANLPMEKYFEKYAERYSSFKPFAKSLAIYSRKGCLWRDASNGGCVFCMIPDSGARCKSPVRLWQEIRHFNDLYGIEHFWEVCDTFTEDDKWIKEFLRTKPSDLDVSFQIYGRPNHITPRMARQLKELGVYEVFIGVESGNDTILKFANKGCTTDHSRRAVESLAKEGINTIVSFVLGLPGETSKTLQETLDFARELHAIGNIVETSASILLPIPGSTSFRMLMGIPGMPTKHCTDLLNLEELKLDWISNYTYVSFDELNGALKQVLDIFPLNDSFEQRALQSAPMC